MTQAKMKDVPGIYERHNARAKEAIMRAQRSACHAGKVIVKRATPKDRGLAQNSWQANMGPKNARPPTPAAWLSNSAPYIGILEKGARPHPVSLQGQRAIYEWVERNFRSLGKGVGVTSDKLSRLGGMLENNLIRNFPGMGLEPAMLNIAASIIQHIRKHGAKPHYFVRMSLPILLHILRDETKRHLRDISKGAK